MQLVCLILAVLSLGTCETKTASTSHTKAPSANRTFLACDTNGHCRAWARR